MAVTSLQIYTLSGIPKEYYLLSLPEVQQSGPP